MFWMRENSFVLAGVRTPDRPVRSYVISRYIDYAILTTLYWLRYSDYAILTALYWLCYIDYVVLTTLYWLRYSDYAILTALYWLCYIDYVILTMLSRLLPKICSFIIRPFIKLRFRQVQTLRRLTENKASQFLSFCKYGCVINPAVKQSLQTQCPTSMYTEHAIYIIRDFHD
jgi:hypothetical protein